jgi:hypothetical protein
MQFPIKTFIVLFGNKYACDTEADRHIAARALAQGKIPETMILNGDIEEVDTWCESGTLLCSDGTTREDAV